VARILYLDCFSGISGDMTLGAFLDAGMPFDALKAALGSLALDGVDVSASKVLRTGVSATHFVVNEHTNSTPSTKSTPSTLSTESTLRTPAKSHAHRHLKGIYNLIDKSALSPAARDRAKAMFERLAEAEAAIHQMPVEKVHLHEVGAIDSIIDIVGAAFAFEWANVERVVCSPLNVGGGMVTAAHGVFPVPAPATVRILGDTPVYSGNVQKEMVTPTGALIATAYANSFGPIPAMQVKRVGYGAGTRDNAETPNVLRVMIGESETAPGFSPAGDRVVMLECEIDDMNPQLFGVVMDRLYAAGALEVFYVSVQMKKNRPGTLLTVIAPPHLRASLTEIVFRETTTIGLRYQDVQRECLDREIVPVETPLGTVRFKVARRGAVVFNAVPEFEDCAGLARAKNMSVKDVQAMAVQAYGEQRAAEGKRP